MSFIAIYITYSSEESAQKISHHLVEKRLVACYNIFPISSGYWWQGAIQNDNEFVAIVKTTPALWEKVKKEVEARHPYEVPCIMKIEVEANEGYEEWIRKMVVGY